MELIIGRDHATNRLKVTNGNQSKVFTTMPEMKKDISENHCSITQINEDEFVVKSLKGTTTVNGLDIETKLIKLTDEIKLGRNGYVLPLNQVLKVLNSDENVKPSNRPAHRNSESKSNSPILRMIAAAMTVFAGILSSIIGAAHPVVLIIDVIVLFMIIFAIYDACKDKNARKRTNQ